MTGTVVRDKNDVKTLKVYCGTMRALVLRIMAADTNFTDGTTVSFVQMICGQ